MIFNEIVDVFRAEWVTDAYGHRRDWAGARRVASVPAVVLPVSSSEEHMDRETVTTRIHIYIRPVDVKASDRVRVNNLTYEVRGNPITWKGRTASYMRITAEAVADAV